MSTPHSERIHIKQYTVKQNTSKTVGLLPIRSIILGPSGSGKPVLLQNMILDIYTDCFNIIYIISPSVEVGAYWLPVKKENGGKKNAQRTDADPIYLDHYDTEALHEILDTQHKITEYPEKTFSNIDNY